MLRVVVGPLDPDGVGRTRIGAQLAPDALLQAVHVAIEAVATDVRTWWRGIDLPGVLLRNVGPEDLSEHGGQALGDGSHGTAEGPRPRGLRLPHAGLLVPGPLAQSPLVHCGVSPPGGGRGTSRGHTRKPTKTAPATINAPVNSVPLPYTSGSTTTAAVARTQSSPNGIRNFHPKLISRSYRIRGRVSRTQMYT